jgi:cyclopropane-fatty-acyl-phospholipid synthase
VVAFSPAQEDFAKRNSVVQRLLSRSLDTFVSRFVRVGRLTLVLPGLCHRTYGDGSGAEVQVRLVGRAAPLRIALDPEMALGECYMDGSLVLERGDINDLVELIGRNFTHDPQRKRPYPIWRKSWFWLVRQLRQINGRLSARQNIEHHYDISNSFYGRFLDSEMQYSCAYFARPDMTLEQAQVAKMAHIASKLLLAPGQKLLDIGCGWGGLGVYLSDELPGGEILGVTLSAEQIAVAQERVVDRQRKGLENNIRFELSDYRDIQGRFDRIVSVGMFEHVGQPNYQEYFDTVARLLTDDGIAVIHSIGRCTEPATTNKWVEKYIFPGGYIPALSEVLPAIERAGLWVTDVEILRLHYAETLRHWRERFTSKRDEIAQDYDERFCRMFEFYLATSEMAFRHAGHMVFQLQLAKRVCTVPLVRDYIDDTCRRPIEVCNFRTNC